MQPSPRAPTLPVAEIGNPRYLSASMNRSLRSILLVLLVSAALFAPSVWLLWHEEPGQTLLQAAYDGDARRVEAILRAHPEVVDYRPLTTQDLENRPPWSSGVDNYVWRRKAASTESLPDLCRIGYSALHIAVHFNHAEVVNVLLAHHANLEVTDLRDRTPLCTAYLQQRPQLQLLLVNAGANVNVQSYQNMTPLHWSISQQDEPLVKLLLARGADPNVANTWSVTPLMLAAERGQTQVVDDLIRHGAKLDAIDGNGRSVLRYAQRSKDTNLVMRLTQLGAP